MRSLARKLLQNPVEINIAISKPPEQIVQEAFIVYDAQKDQLIQYLLHQKDYSRVIVFCSKKQNVKQLTAMLKRKGFPVEEIHSDLAQDKREQVLLDFRNKKYTTLVATDILSRGIDIEDIELVINYDVPNDGEDYVHRIGRTARAASTGTAYTLVNESEQRKFAVIEKLLGKEVTKAQVPEELGPVPAYNPAARRSSHGGDRDRGRPGANRQGGNRSGGNRSGGNRSGGSRPGGRPGGHSGGGGQGGGNRNGGSRSGGNPSGNGRPAGGPPQAS
jgi:superfamily II DNA/RNA helicase